MEAGTEPLTGDMLVFGPECDANVNIVYIFTCIFRFERPVFVDLGWHDQR